MRGYPAVLSAPIGALSLFLAGSVHGETTKYGGAHPIPVTQVGNFCHIDALHTHSYSADTEAFQFLHVSVPTASEETALALEFAGDPSEEGYEGPLISYYGEHPLLFQGQDQSASLTAESCKLSRSHFHLREPLHIEQYDDHRGTYYYGSYREARRASQEQRTREKKRERTVYTPSPAPPEDLVVSTELAESTSTNPQPVTPRPDATRKPKNKAFQSWMARRRGR